jgi:WD40-like Beta Propeller Repeat
MNGRDLFILAAVLLVGGFAVADAIRSEAESTRPQTRAEEPTTRSSVVPSPPEDLGRTRFPGVSGAGGSVVFTQPGTCPVREVDVSSGLEFPNVVSRSSCELWAAPVTGKIAVGIGQASRDAVPFRFLDLAGTSQNLGGSRALFAFLIWSDDGQRAAWCTRPTTGFDVLVVARESRRLSECPADYTPDGEIAYARESLVVVEGGRIALRASGTVTFVDHGSDGSVAVLVDGTRIERWSDGRRQQLVNLPAALRGKNPIFSPDNCAALFRDGDAMRLVDVGCSRFEENTFSGTTAAWSPNGRWIAVGGPRLLVFHDLEGGQPVSWEVGAVAVAWRR